jgi:hypothetical protein
MIMIGGRKVGFGTGGLPVTSVRKKVNTSIRKCEGNAFLVNNLYFVL